MSCSEERKGGEAGGAEGMGRALSDELVGWRKELEILYGRRRRVSEVIRGGPWQAPEKSMVMMRAWAGGRFGLSARSRCSHLDSRSIHLDRALEGSDARRLAIE